MNLNIRAKQKQSNKPFNTGNVILISIAHFLHDIYTSFLAPVLPIIIKQLQLSYAAAGTLTVVLRLPSLLNPFVGIIADKISIRYFVIVAPALTAFFMTLTGNATSYIFLVILLFFAGISS
ncbi:MAG: MFS transporter, partial [bacterium]